ncbi:MAG: GNAT family N-acetyltransferase [Betaproteobacteria bacterium]
MRLAKVHRFEAHGTRQARSQCRAGDRFRFHEARGAGAVQALVRPMSAPQIDPILRDIPDAFASSRLRIRAPRAGDGQIVFDAIRESIADLRRFPASLSWALAEPSLDAAEKYCREAYSNFLMRRDLPLLLLLKDTDVVVGSSGLHRMNWAVPKFEVGFWGRSSFQGKGYATEGVAAIVEFAFGTLGARRVEAFPDEANDRSCKVCERVGLTLEGTLRNERIDPDGTLRNTRVYARIQ